jgi:hypothetical protein
LAIFCQIANASSESATIRKNIDDAKRQQFLRAQGSSKRERLGVFSWFVLCHEAKNEHQKQEQISAR